MTNSHTQNFKIGDRVECAGYFGTVKYIGPIEGKPQIWLGIDWDDPERGKHNGIINGVQYFTTRYEKSGSFIRPEKVQFQSKSVVAAISSRYGQNEDDFTAKINQQNHLLMQKTINAPFLEMVGFDKVFVKQSDLRMLKVVNLRAQNVSSAGFPTELKQQCPLIEELDLSCNLLSNWSEIFDICSQLDCLHWLNVSSNLMVIPDTYNGHHYPQIRTLICGSMELTWNQILMIASVFPNIEEFRAPFNNITHLSVFTDVFLNLKVFDISGNPIKEWGEVCKLNNAPNLEHLLIQNIELSLIRFNYPEFIVPEFRNLKNLCLVDNLISDWQSIAELNRLQNLENLKISNNPITTTDNKETVYQIIIAKITKLKFLNGVEISDTERKGAEYDYIKRYGLEWLKIKNTPEVKHFLTIHNRYLELIEKYGEPEESELKVETKVIQNSLIELTFKYENKIIKKKIPPTINIQKVVMMVQKLFGINQRPLLTYVSKTNNNIKIDLKDELKDIGTYVMQNGDEILVNIVN